MSRIYHNPRCSKSRQALALLQEHGVEPEIILYLETPPSATELKKLAALMGLGPREMMRTGEAEYKAQGLADTALSDDALFEAMATYPKLIERPIVIHNSEAVIARPPEKLLEII